MYTIEFIVITTRYIVLLLKLRITFVPFLTAGFAFTDRVKNPMQQPRDSTRVEKSNFFFTRTSAQVVLTTPQVV